jgi:hypothetical protein
MVTKKRKTAEIAEAAVQVGVQFGATALAVGTGPATALVLASLAPATSLLIKWSDERRAKRLKPFLETFLEGIADVSPEEAEAKLREAGEDPRARESILEALRAVGDSLAAVVVPPLGRLVRTYAREKRGPDVFFRGMRRVLTDLSEDEFEAFRDFVRRADGVRFSGEHPNSLELLYSKTADDTDAQLHATRRWAEELAPKPGSQLTTGGRSRREQKMERIGLGRFDFAVRLFNLLKVNGLAETGLGVFGASDSVQLLIDVQVLRRIRSILEV